MSTVKYKKLIEEMKAMNPNAEIVEGFNNCIVALAENSEGVFFVYDANKIVAKLGITHNMTKEAAWTCYEESILGAQYVKTGSPVFIITN